MPGNDDGRLGAVRRHTFTTENVDAAIEYVIRNGAENSGESQLVTQFMAVFHGRCIERNLPPLDSLVVHVAGERERWPGTGYFRVNRQPDPLSAKTNPAHASEATRFWERQKEKGAAPVE